MRISDWSSDVCSSDLPRYSARGVYERMAKHRVDFLTDGVWQSLSADAPFCLRNHRVAISYSTPESSNVSVEEIVAVMDGLIPALASINVSARKRSEEHTSELQSLMRISYAVFCLKKKKNY